MDCKRLVIFSICFLSITSLTIVRAANTSIPVPSIPEFRLQYQHNSYDVPPSILASTDPYTGKIVNTEVPGYYVENRTIELTIKNQPFTAYESNGQTINLSYTVRFKGHYAQNWFTLFDPETGITASISGYTVISSPDYTKYSFHLGEQTDVFGTGINQGGQVDFQVEALVGSVHRDATQFLAPWVFDGQTSGWSDTQTIDIPAYSSTATSSISPTPNTLISSVTPVRADNILTFNGLDWVGVAVVVILAAVVGSIVMVVFLRRKL